MLWRCFIYDRFEYAIMMEKVSYVLPLVGVLNTWEAFFFCLFVGRTATANKLDTIYTQLILLNVPAKFRCDGRCGRYCQ